MSKQEEIIVWKLNKNPNISITDLESMTGLPIGEVCKLRYFMETGKETGGEEMIWLCLFVSDFIDYHL